MSTIFLWETKYLMILELNIILHKRHNRNFKQLKRDFNSIIHMQKKFSAKMSDSKRKKGTSEMVRKRFLCFKGWEKIEYYHNKEKDLLNEHMKGTEEKLELVTMLKWLQLSSKDDQTRLHTSLWKSITTYLPL